MAEDSDDGSSAVGEEDLTFTLDGPRSLMYRELEEEFGDNLNLDLKEALQQRLTMLYDNRENVVPPGEGD